MSTVYLILAIIVWVVICGVLVALVFAASEDGKYNDEMQKQIGATETYDTRELARKEEIRRAANKTDDDLERWENEGG